MYDDIGLESTRSACYQCSIGCFLKRKIELRCMRSAFFLLTDMLLLHFSSSPLEKEKANKGGGSAGEMKDQSTNSKQEKPKPTKAERRAIQEAQRAAKAAAKGVY